MSHPEKFVPIQTWNNLSNSAVKCFTPKPYPLICQAMIYQRSLKGSSFLLLSPQGTGILGEPLLMQISLLYLPVGGIYQTGKTGQTDINWAMG